MRPIIFLFALLLPVIGYGQIQKCKYARNEIDKFSEQHITVSKWYSIGENSKRGNVLKAELTRIDTTYILKLWADGGRLGCVSSSSQAHFKSNDGTILILSHIGGVDCGNTAYVGGVTAHANPHIILALSSSSVAFLKKPITMVRLMFADVYGDYDVSLPMNFQQIIQCVDAAGKPK
jgi:hypothetical protein